MRALLTSLGILGAIVLLAPARAGEPPRNPKPANTALKSQQTADSLPPGEYVGRLVSINADDNALVLRITTRRQVLKNPDGPTRTADQIIQDVGVEEQKIGKLYQDAVISRSIADYQRKQKEIQQAVSQFQKGLPKQLNQLQQQMENPQPVEYITVTEPKEVPLTTAKDVHVRLREAPGIDDDGRLRTTYTAEEIRQMKGKEPNAPGYDGKLRNLNPGDYVRVIVVPKEPAKGADKKNDDVDPEGRARATEISSITVITKQQAEIQEGGRP